MATGADAAVIELRGVHKRFRGESVLRGIDLRVHAGETLTILGGSGAGKSVCLKLMVGLLRPDAGEVRIFGREIGQLGEDELVAVRTAVSMVFQSAALFDSLNVHDNVAYPLREHLDWSEERIDERVRSCLDSVGLSGVERRMPAELSGGMRKRVGVARGIALEPQVILYDEPTTGLDPANQRRVGELIRTLQQRLGVTSVVVTHELELCFGISDRVAFLRDGKIALVASVEEIRSSDLPELRAFIEGRQDDATPPGDAGATAEGAVDGP